MEAVSDTPSAHLPVLHLNPSDLEDFLWCCRVDLDFSDADGSGKVTIPDDIAYMFSEAELREFHESGVKLLVDHPVTGKLIRILLRADRDGRQAVRYSPSSHA